jgi:hypothetical protein
MALLSVPDLNHVQMALSVWLYIGTALNPNAGLNYLAPPLATGML